jgi:nucleoside-diphosphate-sugar epimerase
VRVLVTGGSGFIGSHLVRKLLEEGNEVRVLDSFATGRRENLLDIRRDIDLVEGDVRSYERAHASVRGCEFVFHQAALPSVPRSVQDPLTSHSANVEGTLNILLSARDCGVRRVVFASSSSVYGAAPVLPKIESAMPEPISPYAVAKLAGEGYCRSFSRVYGLETIALRYFNIFGPRQDPLSEYAAVVPNLITALLSKGRFTVYGDGNQSRDFTYVENVVDANVKAMVANSAAGEVYNIASGHQVSISALIAEVESLTGDSVEVTFAEPRSGEVRHSWADVQRANSQLGYVPLVDLHEGLRRTIDHFASEGPIVMRSTPFA